MDNQNHNNGGAGNRARQSNRELLEKSRLSRLPSLPKRNSYLNNQPIERTSEMEEMPSLFGDVEMPRRESFIHNDAPRPVIVAVCAGCNARLDIDDPIQMRFSSCRKCIGIHGRVDAAFDENSKRKKKQMLEKMMRGEK